MKQFKARLLALCALMVLVAASLAPIAAQAQAYGPGCNNLLIYCGPQKGWRVCSGVRQGSNCVYPAQCVNCQ